MEKYQFPRIKDEIQFELFTRDLLNLIYQDNSFQLYGRKGQAQDGLDGYSTTHSVFFQCKHKSSPRIKDSKLEEELEDELNKAKLKIEELSNSTKSKYLFFTTHPNSTKLQDKAKVLSTEHITVEYWGWGTIESYLNDLYLAVNSEFFIKYYSELAKGLTALKTSSQLTSKLGRDSIVGRTKELKKIDNLLKESGILLINGIGGIGKSTIASYYLYTQKEKLSYYGFFEGLESFTAELREPLALKQEKENDAFIEALSKLRQFDGDKILVFDGITNIEENKDKLERILALKDSGYKILLTSREETEDINQYYLDVLLLEDAKELFNSIYEIENEMLLEDILTYLDCHAFFVEMTAKTLRNKKKLTPERIKEKFENGEFSAIQRNRKESFNDYLNELFSFTELDHEEILMLKQLSILPSHKISFDKIELILDEQNNENFEDLLIYLTERGWLQRIEDHYKMHQIIKEYIFIEHSPTFEEIEQIIDFFHKVLSKSESDSQVILFMQDKISFLDSLLKLFLTFKYEDKFNEKIVYLLNPLGYTYQKLSRLTDARKTYELALNIVEKILKENSKARIFTYGNIGNFYMLIEENDLALEFIEKGLLESMRIHGVAAMETVSFFMSKANFLMKQEKCLEATPIYEMIINSRVSHYGEDDIKVGEAFNNLGICFSKQKIYDKAQQCLVRALQIYMDFYKEKHPDMVAIGTNLAEVFMFQNKKDDALTWYNNALEMSLNYWEETNLDTALVYYNFSKYYFKYKEYRQAEKYILKAIKIQTIFLETENSQLLNSIEGLRLIKDELNNHKVKESRNSPCSCGSGKKYKKCCGKPK